MTSFPDAVFLHSVLAPVDFGGLWLTGSEVTDIRSC